MIDELERKAIKLEIDSDLLIEQSRKTINKMKIL